MYHDSNVSFPERTLSLPAECIRAIHAAIDAGSNFLDTSESYSCGSSERVIGRAIAGRRDKVVIGTKFGNIIGEEKEIDMQRDLLEYDRSETFDIRPAGAREEDAFIQSEMTFLASPQQRRAASLIRPEGEGPFPVILYVHWYETHACDSNRTQFLDEAKAMAAKGIMSLLIETMWSDREWFLKRTQADDYDASVEQAIELRRAMDLLLSQPGADPSRFAYVGHDFGAMYGVLAGSVDLRPTCYVLMAGTPRFSDWFLYYPKLEGDARESFIQLMEPLDPIERVGQLSPAPILFQFGNDDPHVPAQRAEAFAAAALEPVDVEWYEAGHGLNEQARDERANWLAKQLK